MATASLEDDMLSYQEQKSLLLAENEQLRELLKKMSQALSYILDKQLHKFQYLLRGSELDE